MKRGTKKMLRTEGSDETFLRKISWGVTKKEKKKEDEW